MTETLAEALPREIARVSAKRDRWVAMQAQHPELAVGLAVGLVVMRSEIETAIRASAEGDVAQMMASLEALRGYSDDD